MRRALVLLPVVGLVLTACGHTRAPAAPACCSAPDDSSVTGVLIGVGGPAGSRPQPWAGTVSARGDRSTTVDTDAHGHFSLSLPPGVYRFTATSPQYDDGRGSCAATRPVTVRAHRPTHVRVVCPLR